MSVRVLVQQGMGLLVTALLFFMFITPTYSQDPSAVQTIEADDPRVLQGGTWSSQATAAASNGSYLFSSGAETDILGLSFVGSAIEIIYVAGPQFGTLAIEVDSRVLRTVITTSEKIEYAQVARIDYLSNEPHTVKVYAQAGGIIAVDAFRIIPNVGDGLGVGLDAPTSLDDEGGIHASTCAPLNTTHRISLTNTGAQVNILSYPTSISHDGRYVGFTTGASLVQGDGDAMNDVYLYDRYTCTIQLISVSSTGVKGNAGSFDPAVSSAGRYVTYYSDATNLVAGDTNANRDVFVYDRQTGTTTRVSVATGGTQATGGASAIPTISADGRYVAFVSLATNLVAGDTNALSDVFVHDRQTITTTRVSAATGGTQATADSAEPRLSADGRFVAFVALANNLVAGDTNGEPDIFVHDRQTGTTTRVSVATGGTQGTGGNSSYPSISSDGRYVSFAATMTNLVAGDTNAASDVFVHDRQTTTTTRVSVATGGTQTTSASSFGGMISGDGRYITFSSGSTNLVSGDTNTFNDVFVHDRQTTTTTRVSVTALNNQATGGHSWFSYISGDGRFVTYYSDATNLVAGDTNGTADTFVSPRITVATDTLALFNPPFQQVNVINTVADNPPANAYTAFSAYAPITGGQWVMGDWNGDGLETPGVYNNGPFFYTNKLGESQPSDWRSLWIGISGPPVAGHFDAGLFNDCIGAVQQAALSGFTVFVLYYTCDLSGNTAPTISSQWLSSVLPDSLGLTGQRQFGAGDFDNDGADTIAVRRDGYIAYTNVIVTQPAEFGFAQFIGAPAATDYGIFVVGDWDANGISSFGLFYQTGEFFYRNDLLFNSGGYFNQSVGTPFGPIGVQATTWR